MTNGSDDQTAADFAEGLLANEELFEEAASKLSGASTTYQRDLRRMRDAAEHEGAYEHLRPLILSPEKLLDVEPPPWLIDTVLPARSLSMMFGKENTGKSFVALDMAGCVAGGLPWLGDFPVEPGPVIYITAEGLGHLGYRFEAWLKARLDGQLPLFFPLYFIPQALHLNTKDGFRRLALALERLSFARPVLVIIDTLHSCTAGMDENSAQDVGEFLKVCEWLRQTVGAAVLTIHHSRKAGDTYRGHSSFAGAADTLIHVKKAGGHDSNITVACTKQKDAEHFDELNLRLNVVELAERQRLVRGIDTTIYPTSCSVERSEGDNTASPNDAIILDFLRSNPEGLTAPQLVELSAGQMSQPTVYTRLKRLSVEGGPVEMAARVSTGTAGRPAVVFRLTNA